MTPPTKTPPRKTTPVAMPTDQSTRDRCRDRRLGEWLVVELKVVEGNASLQADWRLNRYPQPRWQRRRYRRAEKVFEVDRSTADSF